MQKLKLGDKLFNANKVELKYYLDKNYTFVLLNYPSQTIYKDTSYDYPYRFKTTAHNEDIAGCWNGYDYVVTKCPPSLNLTKVIQCY